MLLRGEEHADKSLCSAFSKCQIRAIKMCILVFSSSLNKKDFFFDGGSQRFGDGKKYYKTTIDEGPYLVSLESFVFPYS